MIGTTTTAQDSEDTAVINFPRLDPGEIKRLSTIKIAPATLTVISTFLAIAFIISVVSQAQTPLIYGICFLLIAGIQHHLSIIQHEANHYLLFPNRLINDILGAMCAGLIGFSMSYRSTHLKHHKKLASDQDPDLPAYESYPTPPKEFLARLSADLSGKAAFSQFFGLQKSTTQPINSQRTKEPSSLFSLNSPLVPATMQSLLLCAFALSGNIWNYVFFWLLPLVTVTKTLTHLRTIAEHLAVEDPSEPRLRTIHCNLIEQFFFAPLYFNFHAEHHLYPSVPFSNLPALNKILSKKKEYQQSIPVENGYLNLILSKAIRWKA